MKTQLTLITLFTLLTLVITSCKEPTLDFSEPEDENVIQPPQEITQVNINNNRVYNIPCNGQEFVFKINNVSGELGVLTFKSFRSPINPQDPTDRNDNNCNLDITVVKKNGANALPGNINRTLKPGGTFTDLFDLGGADNLEVKIKCTGTLRYCMFYPPEFRSGKLITNDRKRIVRDVEVHSNPNGNRAYTPVGAGAGANPCTTNETEIHNLYIDYDVKKYKMTITVVARSLTTCEKFIAKVYYDIKAPYKSESIAAGNGTNGNDATIIEVKQNPAIIKITGRCEGNGPANSTCKGDASVLISQKATW